MERDARVEVRVEGAVAHAHRVVHDDRARVAARQLELDGFEVTHTKDDIIWGSDGDDEQTFIDEVKKAIQEGGLDLLLQAVNFRAKSLEQKDKLKWLLVDSNHLFCLS